MKKYLLIGSLLMALAIMLGAFGAHGLEKTLDAKKLAVYETGVRYLIYHSLGFIMLSFIKEIKTNVSALFFALGILLFSFGCMIYAITAVKFFAMIIPVGGLSFILGWLALSFYTLKAK